MMLLFKQLYKLSKGLSVATCIRSRSSSALYVTGDKASETCSVLTPHLDFGKRFEDITTLHKNIELRGMSVNVEALKHLWDLLNDVQANKLQLEKRRVEIANKIKSMKTKKDDERGKNDIDKFRLEGKMVRDDLKNLMKRLWELERNTTLKLLSLPNELHSDTPEYFPKTVYEYGIKLEVHCIESHLVRGTLMNVLKYYDATNYYLIGNGALFELGTLNYFGGEFKKHNYVQVSNTDFGRSVIVEGVGIKHRDPIGAIILKSDDNDVNHDDRLHLVGGASLVSFSALHTKQIVSVDLLPLKYYTLGRQYNPKTPSLSEGLFTAWQASVCEVFIATMNTYDGMMTEFNSALNIITSSYEQLGLHFRVVYIQASDLNPWESLRASIQMYSSHSSSYVEVGHLSLCGDFVSKRLLMSYKDDDSSEQQFMNIVSGTVVSVPKLLACILEQGQSDKFIIPEPIKGHMLNSC